MDKTRKIDSKLITETLKKLFIEANINLGQDVVCSLQDALAREESPLGRQVLEKIIDNAEIAHREKMPICQDTGLAVLFIEIGQDVHIIGGDLRAAIEEGVRGLPGWFCANPSADPLTRKIHRITRRR